MVPEVQTRQQLEFKVAAKIGGYVVTCPDLTKDDPEPRDFVCTSDAEVHDKLTKWLTWIDRDDREIEAVEEHMKARGDG